MLISLPPSISGKSVADHLCRMAMMAAFPPLSLDSQLDVAKCVRMCLFHDTAEALVGDLTPADGMPEAERHRREGETMGYIEGKVLSNVNVAASEEMVGLWREFEEGETLESRFVQDVDKIEMLLQMAEYERRAGESLDLGQLICVETKILLSETRAWTQEIMEERKEFWNTVGRRIQNEASAITFIAANTTIPVPQHRLHEENGLLHLETSTVSGIKLSDIDEKSKAAATETVMRQMNKEILPQLRRLRRRRIGCSLVLRRERMEMEREMERLKVVEEQNRFDAQQELLDTGQQEDNVAEEEDEDAEMEDLLQQLVAEETAQQPTVTIPHHNTIPQPEQKPSLNPTKPLPATVTEEEEENYLTDSDSAFEALENPPEKATQRRIPPPTATPIPDSNDPRQQLQAAIITQNQNQPQPQSHHHHPHNPTLRPPHPNPSPGNQPTPPAPQTNPLSSIPILPYRQNWMINVLCIIVSLDPVQPSHIGPSFIQRTARLADMSTPKHVLLTVYFDPEWFVPEVGEVVLLMG
ncbi:hypothetical protein N0V88_000155 [Collariella sp. IMI 366227]|nr:hypothetical protein N0V88_000155 [Collariella sp. IMI 366227]